MLVKRKSSCVFYPHSDADAVLIPDRRAAWHLTVLKLRISCTYGRGGLSWVAEPSGKDKAQSPMMRLTPPSHANVFKATECQIKLTVFTPQKTLNVCFSLSMMPKSICWTSHEHVGTRRPRNRCLGRPQSRINLGKHHRALLSLIIHNIKD